MVDSAGAKSGNLFAEKPVFQRNPAISRSQAPELKAARALCNQLRDKQTRPDKARLVHLICLNLQAVLKHRSPLA